jgi:tetratricopeptide (TPR) repeat protein
MAFRWAQIGGLALALAGLPGSPAQAQAESAPPPPSHSPRAARPAADAPPEAYDEAGRALWNEAVRLETAGDVDAAAACFERLAKLHPNVSAAYWRAARCHWRIADVAQDMPRDDRLLRFERARRLSEAGAQLDPSCAECLLWEFGSLGRLSIIHGVLWGARHGREMADLLDRGIELNPTSPADRENGTLGNLHYATAVFYRTAPEWFWLEWIIGVKGDLERALAAVCSVLEQNPTRVDYRIELGTILLCLGERRGDLARTEAGLAAMREAVALPPVLESDPIDQHYARLLLEQPAKACNWSRDGFVDMDALTPANLGGQD